METSSTSNTTSRKRSQCSHCQGYEHTKRNCPILRENFTPLVTPRQADRLQPETKMDSDDESAPPDLVPDILMTTMMTTMMTSKFCGRNGRLLMLLNR